jgi:electron transfer flavoprotein alpha/beta subunit
VEILVCIKRVPTVGGKIAVTGDGQEVDTRASGFSISPHEECAVEEAVQITDPGAPILAHADYAVLGDLHQVVPALIQALRAR